MCPLLRNLAPSSSNIRLVWMCVCVWFVLDRVNWIRENVVTWFLYSPRRFFFFASEWRCKLCRGVELIRHVRGGGGFSGYIIRRVSYNTRLYLCKRFGIVVNTYIGEAILERPVYVCSVYTSLSFYVYIDTGGLENLLSIYMSEVWNLRFRSHMWSGGI